MVSLTGDQIYQRIVKTLRKGGLANLHHNDLSSYVGIIDFANMLDSVGQLGDIYKPHENRHAIKLFLPASSAVGDKLETMGMAATRSEFEYGICAGWWLQLVPVTMRMRWSDKDFKWGGMDKEESREALCVWARVFAEWGSEVLSYRRRYATLAVEDGMKIASFTLAAVEVEAKPTKVT